MFVPITLLLDIFQCALGPTRQSLVSWNSLQSPLCSGPGFLLSFTAYRSLPRSPPGIPAPRSRQAFVPHPKHGPGSLLILYTTAKDNLTTLPEILGRRGREVHTRKYPLTVLRSGSVESPQPLANFKVFYKPTSHLSSTWPVINLPPPGISQLFSFQI